jgi:adenylosuccinate synthase
MADIPRVAVILGGQWGDEGKGKVVDYAAGCFQVTARATGGNNAGHTIYVNGEKHIFHLIPSSATWKGVECLMGNGMVIDPFVLLKEMKALRDKGFPTDNLFISGNAHVILLYHPMLDGYQERSKGGGGKAIGTTKRGIGPAYADKKHRTGIRINDLLHRKVLSEKMSANIWEKYGMFRHIYGIQHDEIMKDLAESIPADPLFSELKAELSSAIKSNELAKISEALVGIYLELGNMLRPQVTDVSARLQEALDSGKNILIEGAQGLLLDIDHGTYPFVTSSNPSVGGVKTGLGISRVDEVFSLLKAYTTRVGGGPFPTEMLDDIGKIVREKGAEYGATTGRPRRCGWHDTVLTRHTSKTNGPKVVITKLDILTGISPIKICDSYRYTGPKRVYNGEVFFPGKIVRDFPADSTILENCVPNDWVEMDGWKEDISDIRDFERLPANAKKYLKKIEELGRVEIAIVSVGPERDQTIAIPGVWPFSGEECRVVEQHIKTSSANPKRKGYRAIIYDMDNTLIASHRFALLMLKRTMDKVSKVVEFKRPSDEEIAAVQKRNPNFEKMFDELFPDPESYFGEEPFSRLMLAKYREDAYKFDMGATKEGVNTFNLMARQGLVQVIVTNRTKMASLRLQQAGYPEVERIFSPPSDAEKKPSPKAFEPALNHLNSLGIAKDEVLSIGDHPDDYLASKSAGIDFVAVLTGLNTKEEFESLGLDKGRIIENIGLLKEIVR